MADVRIRVLEDIGRETRLVIHELRERERITLLELAAELGRSA